MGGKREEKMENRGVVGPLEEAHVSQPQLLQSKQFKLSLLNPGHDSCLG